jgi:prepilin-type N-terminal cleavage/methylation domain-containing protein
MTPAKLLRNGFTLIELLVVVAVLGILAAVVLVALDPLEQTARGRDSGRISTIAQLGHGLQSYATIQNGSYPLAAGWMSTLVSVGELKQIVTVPASPDTCTPQQTGNVCYTVIGSDAVVWTVLESKYSKKRANDCETVTVAMYSTIQGQAGIACIVNKDVVTGNEKLY